MSVDGQVAFVPQEPWVQNASVRDNILFGRPFDQRRYQQCLATCALRQDLESMPAGDLTELG